MTCERVEISRRSHMERKSVQPSMEASRAATRLIDRAKDDDLAS
jgi:hypothetical protein